MTSPLQGSASALLCLGLGVLIGTSVSAAEATADDDSALQQIVVTGSLIARSAHDAPGPMRVITAQDIKASGYTDVSDVLRNLPANGAGTLSQAYPGAYAGGASAISLRGLNVGATLTLIDGHRMVPYPLSDDNQRSFVDLSSLPTAALDRIEVLEDGASAEYGSDAIAGVVNVLLKQTYEGAEIDAEAGISQKHDGALEHVSGIAGLGDLQGDGFNIYGAFEFRHQNPIPLGDRDGLYTNRNWTAYGGLDTTPGSAASVFFPYPASNSGYLINPSTDSGLPYAFLPGCDAARQAADQCVFQHAVELQPPTRNLNFLGRASLKLPAGWQLSATASLFNSQSRQLNTQLDTEYPFGQIGIGLQPGAAPIVVGPTLITAPANYPGNSFGAPAPLVYTFEQLGPAENLFETNTYRLSLELHGQAGLWNVSSSIQLQYSRTDVRTYNFVEPTILQAALNAGYVLGQAANGDGARLFAPEAENSATSTLNVFSVNASRSLLDLPGGPLSAAAGAEFDQRVANLRPATSVEAGLQAGNNAYAIGSQDDVAAFTEFNARILKQLELSAALRYDHYNTYGSSVTPKFGLHITPVVDGFSLQGTWGRGFRAPNPAEAQKSALSFLNSATPDQLLCANPPNPVAPGNFPSQCEVFIPALLEANPKLEPERSTNLTAGFMLRPSGVVELSADYYRISVSHVIIPSFEAGGFENSTVTPADPVRGPPVSLPFVNPDGSITNSMTPVGTILYQPYTYINASSSTTSGIDVALIATLPAGDTGTFSAQLDYTHVISYSLTAYGLTYELAGTHGPSFISGDTGNPRDRAQLALSWTSGAATIRTTINYISAFNLTDPSVGQNSCEDAAASSGSFRFPPGVVIPAPLCTVDHFVDADLYGAYRLNRHLTLHASVLNLFNRQPPLDLATYGGGSASYDPALHQAGAIGRFLSIGASATL